MKRIRKSKSGFTLLEMVFVVAIICILAAVMIIQSSEARMSELGFDNVSSAASVT